MSTCSIASLAIRLWKLDQPSFTHAFNIMTKGEQKFKIWFICIRMSSLVLQLPRKCGGIYIKHRNQDAYPSRLQLTALEWVRRACWLMSTCLLRLSLIFKFPVSLLAIFSRCFYFLYLFFFFFCGEGELGGRGEWEFQVRDHNTRKWIHLESWCTCVIPNLVS